MAAKETAPSAPAPAAGTLSRLLGLSRPYLGSYLVLCLFTACVSASAVVLAESLRRIVNAATNRSTAELGSALLLGIASILLDAGGNYAKTLLAARLEYTSTAKLQASVLRKVLRIKTKDLEGYHSADLISRMGDSAAEAQKGLNDKAVDLLGNLLQIVFVLTYLISMEWTLTVGTVLISVLTPLVMLPFTRKLRGLYESRQKAAAAQQAFVQDTVQGAELVKSFGLFARMQESFRQKYEAYMSLQARVLRIEAVGYRMPFIVIIGGLLYVLGFGGYLVIRGKLDVGALAAFLVSFEQLANPLSRVSNLWTELQGALGQAGRMFEVLDLEEEDSAAGKNDIDGTRGVRTAALSLGESRDLVLEKVSYRYEQDRLVLDGVSLVIEAGKTTAFAGPSGGGKSTLMKLLLKAYEPEEGSIRYGDEPLAAIPARSWREGLAYVPQEPYLFSGTLYDNIAWGRPGATREEVEEAARRAAIHEFIMRTPEQYSTRIGERGLTLSGGERQRLSIARAFVRDPKLLLLDEPTSALDSGSEEIVQTALAELMRGRTTVVIAHRLSTIRDADRIFYLEGGRVLEAGTHDELIRLDGRYRSMHERGRENAREDAIASGTGGGER